MINVHNISKFSEKLLQSSCGWLASGWYVLGKEYDKFESPFKCYLVGDAKGDDVSVNSGTEALSFLGIEPGDEGITVANTAANGGMRCKELISLMSVNRLKAVLMAMKPSF